MSTVTSGGGRSYASSNQLFWLYRLVRRRFTPTTDRQEASDIIGKAIDIRKQGIDKVEESVKQSLVQAVRKHFADWTIDELNLDFIPQSGDKKPKPPAEKKPSQPPAPKPTTPAAAAEQAIKDVEAASPDTMPYTDLPQGTQEKIKEIERILKDKAVKKPVQDVKPSADKPNTAVQEEEKPNTNVDKDIVDKLPKDFVIPKDFNHWLKLAEAKINFMLCGPAGCGKTYSATMIARALDLEYFDCTFSGGVRYNQVFGSTKISDGESVWEPAELLKAVQRPCLVIINEILAADADVTIGLNPLLEPSQRFINTPGGRIDVHPDCRFIATANNKGRQQSRGYIGAQIQDGSILDRFGIKFDVDYDESVEMNLVKQFVDHSTAKWLVDNVKKLRDKLRQNEINFDPSTRRLVLCCRQIKEAKIDYLLAFETTFMTSLSRAERQTIGM